MGVGSATGKDKAELAAKAAISSPLLETSIKGARGILISISVSPDVGLEDVDLASTLIANEADPQASVIWGVAFDPDLEDEMRITIIATGFEKKPEDNNVPAKVKPNTALRTDNAVKTELDSASDAKASEAKATEKKEKATVASDDFDDIIRMLKDRKK